MESGRGHGHLARMKTACVAILEQNFTAGYTLPFTRDSKVLVAVPKLHLLCRTKKLLGNLLCKLTKVIETIRFATNFEF